MKKFCPKFFGFTLIELLVVISIIGILFTVGLAFYNDFNRRQIVVQSAKELKDQIRSAQSKALSGEKDCSPDYCGGVWDDSCSCYKCDLSSKALDGWYIDFSGSGYRLYGRCETIEFGSVTTALPSGFALTPPLTNPLPFWPLAQGVGISAEEKICISGFGKYYRLKITPSGEIKDDGFTACP